VTVSAPAGCSWTASSHAPWLIITSGASGSGNGTVTYTVVPLALGDRTGTLSIANRTFTLRQSGLLP
jgi:hypothetical protein